MEKFYDVIVVGAGAVGSATTRCLAKSGLKVMAIDQFQPPHNFGSSHGDTRVTRLAIGEGNFYTPFAVRSHQIWRELEEQTGLDLLNTIGGIVIAGQSDNSVLHGNKNFLAETFAAANRYNIPHSFLTGVTIRSKMPRFNLTGDEIGYYEPTMGFLRPENCIKAQLDVARKYGGRIKSNTKVTHIRPMTDKVLVQTSSGPFTAGKVIVSAGAWVGKLLGEKYSHLFEVHRQVLYWFDVRDNYRQFLPENFPVFIWNRPGDFIYGFPAIDGPNGGLKIASENKDVVDADSVNRDVSQEEIERMYEKIKNSIEGVGPKCIKTAVCMSTETADKRFIIDYHPEWENVIIASPCCNHGFKHSAAIGEALDELVVHGKPTLDISPFSLKRFSDKC